MTTTKLWCQPDDLFRRHDQFEEARAAERLRRRNLRPSTEVLGYTVPAHPPEVEDAPPTTDYMRKLLDQIDEEARQLRQARPTNRGGTFSGRRGALIAHRDLAVSIRMLCVEQGVLETQRWLGISRQSLRDVWLAHELDPPCRRPRPRGSRAGGMRS